MPKFNPKDYIVPINLEDALNLLSQHGDKAKIIAGGTTFFELSQRGLLSDVEYIIDIQKLGLGYFREEEHQLRIGAGTILSDLMKEKALFEPAHAALGEAIRKVEPIQVRNIATIGGAICAALPFFDVPIALAALEANLAIRSFTAEKTIPIASFFLDYFTPKLDPDEILVEVLIPKATLATGSCFLKISRTAYDFGLVTCATKLTLDNGGRVDGITIVLGNVAGTPYRAEEVEKLLIGKVLNDTVIGSAAERLSSLDPAPSVHGSAEYKRKLSKVLVRDAVRASFTRAK